MLLNRDADQCVLYAETWNVNARTFDLYADAFERYTAPFELNSVVFERYADRSLRDNHAFVRGIG